VLNEKPLEK